MELIEGLQSRRSIRKYQAKPVPRQLLEEIISSAAYAPSWKNSQITRYIAIDDRAVIDHIAENYAQFNANRLSTAPLVIVQCFEKGRCGFEPDGSYSTDRGEGWQYYDCGIAAQSFALAAHAHGLGTLIMGLFDRAGLQDYLKLPESMEIMALISCGYPAESPKAPSRKSPQELLSYFTKP